MKVEIGDYVYWTHVSQGRGTLSMSLREGKVETIVGDSATIKKRNGRTEKINLKRLRWSTQKTQIHEFVEILMGRDL